MINVNNFKPGITFLWNGDPFVVVSASHSKQGRGQATVRSKIKNLRTGTTIIKNWVGGEKIPRAHIAKEEVTYLYDKNSKYVFMNTASYEQVEIEKSHLKWESNFLVPNLTVNLKKFENIVLGVELPANVVLKVLDAPTAVKGNTQNSAQKIVVLETGYKLRVPLFIKNGEKIFVSTSNGKYVSRKKSNPVGHNRPLV